MGQTDWMEGRWQATRVLALYCKNLYKNSTLKLLKDGIEAVTSSCKQL